MNRHFLIVGAAICFGAGAGHAASVTVGTANSNNCLPFGCASSNQLTAQQQIYASSAFAGPTTIGSVSFYKDAVTPPGATLETMSFNLSFYTSPRTVAGLSSNLASNLGTLLADFGTFSLAGAVPDVLTFASLSSFVYNPAAGNLLLQITVLSDTAAGSNAFFKSDNTPAVTRRAVSTSIPFNFAATNALVTTFSSNTRAAAVPEPATWTMLIAGFGLVGAGLRRRSVSVRFA